MSDLRDLYQEVILDHSKRPRNHRRPDRFDATAAGHNPLCGDRITVFLTVSDGVLTDVTFEGQGCAISQASASMMTEALRGRTVDEARALFEKFHGAVTGAPGPVDDLGKLAAFEGVREFPVRVKCATLAWHTLRSALDASGAKVTTE